jgi:hypothetical protein
MGTLKMTVELCLLPIPVSIFAGSGNTLHMSSLHCVETPSYKGFTALILSQQYGRYVRVRS